MMRIVVNKLFILFSLFDAYTSIQKSTDKSEFPIKDFLGISGIIYDKFAADYKSRLLCGRNKSQASGCCSCADDCMKYQICCADFLWYDRDYENISEYTKYLIAESKRYKLHYCLNGILHITNFLYYTNQYYMVQKCRKGASLTDQNLCEQGGNKEFQSVVSVIGNDGILYANTFCAWCNKVDEFELVSISMKCKTDKILPHECLVSINSTKNVKTCSPLIQTCMIEEYYDLCFAFKGYVNYRWANYFCLLCFFHAENYITKKIPTVDKSCTSSHGDLYFDTHNLTISTTLEFVARSDILKCLGRDVIDALNGKCVPFLCPQGYKEYKTKCRKFPVSNAPFKKEYIEIFDKCLITSKASLFGVDVFGSQLVGLLGITVVRETRKLKYFVSQKNETIVNLIQNVDETTLEEIMSFEKGFLYNMPMKSRFIVSASSLDKHIHRVDASQVFPKDRICMKAISLRNNIQITPQCDVIHDGIKIEKQSLSFRIDMSRFLVTRSLFACKNFYMSPEKCSLRILSQNMTLYENGTLHDINGEVKETYDIKDYVPVENGSFGVCSHSNRLDQQYHLANGYIVILLFMIFVFM